MPPYEDSLSPVALPGEAVKVVPDGDVYEVLAIEQLGRIGPTDYGSASSGQDAQENSSSIIDLGDELEMDSGTLGQFWINPLSDVEVEIRQTGQQEQRLVNSNEVGKITPRTPAPHRQVFVFEDEAPHGIITNPQTWDMAKTLVYYTGYKLVLSDNPVGAGGFSGAPATVPVDSLKQNTISRGGRP